MFTVLKRGSYSFIPPPWMLNNPPSNGSELSSEKLMALPFLDKVQPLLQRMWTGMWTGSSSTRFHRGRTLRASSFNLCQPVQGVELILINQSLVGLLA